MSDKPATRFMHLLPILTSLMFGLLCASLVSTSSIEPYPITPFSEELSGPIGNAFYFVVLAGVGATLLYVLLKSGKYKLISVIIGFALVSAVFLLSMIYVYAALLHLGIVYIDALVLIVSLLITVFAGYLLLSNDKFANVATLGLGGALGAFLGFSIPTASVVLILSLLAVYDVFAVYRGPVGKIARSGLEKLRGLTFSFRGTQIGLGDLTFYSLLSGHMLIYFGSVSGLASIAGILMGCVASFKMLDRREIFPGLPLPILLGLVMGFLVLLV